MKLLAIAFIVCYSICTLTEAGKKSRGKAKAKTGQATTRIQQDGDAPVEEIASMYDLCMHLAQSHAAVHQSFGPDENGEISVDNLCAHMLAAGVDEKSVLEAYDRIVKQGQGIEEDTGDERVNEEESAELTYLAGRGQFMQQHLDGAGSSNQETPAFGADDGNEGSQGSKGKAKKNQRNKHKRTRK